MGGQVLLVGAGPGDPELLTVRALRAIETADVVVFDRLVSPAILALIPGEAERFDVGKRAGSHPMPQPEINKLLVRLGRTGRRIVRLKGGDPFMFGRGGEEALELAAAGITYDVVPGITSAQGCAATLRMPLTHRQLATGVRFVTGHCRADRPLDLDWEGLADDNTTLVVYMGVANIAEIAHQLIANGRSPSTLIAAVSKGTQADETHLVSTLATIADDVGTALLPSPVLFIIGKVVGLAPAMGGIRHAPVRTVAVAAE
jgi:uroporphyrin-III C-methyltransferase